MIHQRITDASPKFYDSRVNAVVVEDTRDIVKALMIAHGFRSARKLAEAAGIQQPTLARFLNNSSHSMEVANLQALCRVFGVTLSELIGEVPLGSSVVAREVNRTMGQMTIEQQEQLLRISRALVSPKPPN